jgi:phosphoribosyl 1,2-cyclic phosphodiesterase
VRAGKTALLIDCGISPARLKERLAPLGLAPGALTAALITHEHSDHAGGAGALARRFGVPLHMSEGTARGACERILRTKKEQDAVRFLPRSGRLEFDDVSVDWVPVPHDAREPVAFAVERKGVRFGVLTDLGHASRPVRDWFETLDAVALEANHDRDMLDAGPYPMMLKRRIASRLGHLSNEQARRLVLDHAAPRLRAIVMAHLSAENNAPQFAEEAIRDALERRRDLEDVSLTLAKRDGASEMLAL